MKLKALTFLMLFAATGCGGSPSSSSSPTSPTAAPPAGGGTLSLSGFVFGVDATGRRPLVGAMVELSESADSWTRTNRPVTDATGRYVLGGLTPGRYHVRATRTGYDGSPVTDLGLLDAARRVDFELSVAGTATGPLTITGVDPDRGITGGGTTVKITGSGFQSSAIVTFGAERVSSFLLNSTTLYATTTQHAPAIVDVAVTRPSGDSARLTAGYTFALPQSFDFNGTWEGYALAHPDSVRSGVLHSDMDMQFTVLDNVLVSFTCGGAATALSPPPAVSGGEFAVARDDARISGRIVSPVSAMGTIDTAACPGTRWSANRR